MRNVVTAASLRDRRKLLEDAAELLLLRTEEADSICEELGVTSVTYHNLDLALGVHDQAGNDPLLKE